MNFSPTFPASDRSQAAPSTIRVYWKWSFMVSALVLLFLMWKCGSALISGMSLTDTAVKQFHQQLNNQQYQEIYQEADPALGTGKAQEQLGRFFEALHKKLGAAKSETRINLWVSLTSNQTFINAQYHTEFASGSAVETFTWTKQGNILKLYGYRIQSNSFLD